MVKVSLSHKFLKINGHFQIDLHGLDFEGFFPYYITHVIVTIIYINCIRNNL